MRADSVPAVPNFPPSGEISVVTVSDAQDRTSAGSLSAVNTIPQPAAAPTIPIVTAGPGPVIEPDGAGQQAPADTQPAQATAPGQAPEHVSERRERAEGPEPAAALTADRLLNRTAAPPVEGWRRWLFQATFGYVNLGDPDRIRIQRAMEHRIAMRLGERTRYVPVLSRKGGVGKTTVTTLLGMVLADLREDRVIAMDANPDRGTLSDRSPGRADFTARQLVKDRFTVNSFAQLSNYTARDGSRLDVLASDTDPMVAHAFDDADYRAVTDILGRYYSIVLTDSGTGMVHSVMKGTLEKADAVVLVSGGSVDEARLASETLSWLEAHGRQDLVAKATVVINMAAGDRTLVNIDEIEQHFLSRVKNVVRIPHDRHLAEGSRIQLSQLRPATRGAAVELAALVMDELQQA
jgi:MinD-like ATPase involved in chromosome partitioning or flagellar assembly